jgi:hypothetical protein
MKFLKSGALCVLLCIFSISMYAQNEPLPVNTPDYNKPKLFADLPEKFSIDVQAFAHLFDVVEGQNITVRLTGPFNYVGTVVSRSNPRDNAFRSVVIRSTNRQGAVLTFTRTLNTDGSYAYIGRILSHKHSDAFEVEQQEGQYVLVKKHLYDLFNE